jgi:tape measure domain-containing protein
VNYGILISMAADVARLKSDMAAAKRSVDEFGKAVSSTLKGAFAGLGIGVVAREFIQMSDAITLADARLKLVTKSAEEFAAAQKEVFRIAQLNQQGLVETSQLFQRLAPAVQQMGGSMKEVGAITAAFAASLRVSGASVQEAASSTLQFAQAMGSGKVAGDEFRALAEANPRFMRAVAEGLKVPVGALKEMSKEGKLTSDVVANALVGSLKTLVQEAAAIPTTVGGAFNQLKNELMVFGKGIEESTGLYSAFVETVQIAAQFIVEIGRAMKGTGVDIRATETLLLEIGTVFETLIVLGTNVAYVFTTIGKEIGAMAAQIALMVQGDFKGAGRVRDMWREDAAKARAEVDAFSERMVGATQRAIDNARAMRESGAAAGVVADEYTKLKSKVPTADQLKAAEAAAKLRAELLDQISVLERNTETTTKLSDAQKLMLKVGEALRDNKLQLKEGEAQLMMARLQAVHATEQAREREEELLKARQESLADELKILASIKDQIKSQQDENAQLGLNTKQLAEYRVGKEKIVLANLKVKASTLELSEAETRAIQAQIAAQEELIAVMQHGDVRRASVEAANASRDAWLDFARDIESALTDAMVRGFNGSKSIVQSIGEWIVNYFKTTVARGIAQSLMAAIAAGMSSAASASGGGGGSGLGSLLSVGASLFGGGGGGASGIGSLLGGVGGMASIIGSFGGTGFLGGVGATLSGTASMGGLSALGSMAGGGSLSAGAAALGVVAPYLALAYGLYRVISGVGTGRMRGPAWQQWSSQTAGGGAYNPYAGVTNNPALGGAGYFNGQIASIIGAVNAGAAAFGGRANRNTAYGLYVSQGTEGSGALADARVQSASGRALFGYSNNGGNADVYQRLMSAVPGMVLAGLQDSDLPPRIKEYFNSVSANAITQEQLDGMLKTAGAAHQMAEAFKQLGGPFAQIQNLSVDARMALADLAGGIEAFSQKVASYYSNFYSAEEQQAMSLLSAQRTLAGAGIDTSNLRSREDFRRAVEGVDLSSAEGQQRFAAYMNAAGAFASGSDLLSATGMSLSQLTAGAPNYDSWSLMAEGQAATVVSLGQVNDTLTQVGAAIVAAIKDQQIEVDVKVNSPAAVDVGWVTGGGN